MQTAVNVLPIESIYPNPDQPRKEFDQSKLEELAMSIKEYGILEPVVVTPRGDRYMIIAGERRYRASVIAKLSEIPARVIEADDALVEELALLENIQRQDLSIIEEARAFKGLLDRGWTKEELARKMGFKQVWRVDERLSLLNLSDEFQAMVVKGDISNSQAFEMSRVAPVKQSIILKKILSGELNTYNKLRAFVDAMKAIEAQTAIFELQPITEEETRTIDLFKGMLNNIERFIRSFMSAGADDTIKKAVYHSDISAERVDYLIQNLMKIRKTILAGQGMKSAIKEVA